MCIYIYTCFWISMSIYINKIQWMTDTDLNMVTNIIKLNPMVVQLNCLVKTVVETNKKKLRNPNWIMSNEQWAMEEEEEELLVKAIEQGLKEKSGMRLQKYHLAQRRELRAQIRFWFAKTRRQMLYLSLSFLFTTCSCRSFLLNIQRHVVLITSLVVCRFTCCQLTKTKIPPIVSY